MEYVLKRISGKEKEIGKLEKKLVRLQKAEAGGWKENNPYYYSESWSSWTAGRPEAGISIRGVSPTTWKNWKR